MLLCRCEIVGLLILLVAHSCYGRVCPRVRNTDMPCPDKNVCQRNSECLRGKICCYHACRRTVCVDPASKEEVDEILRGLYRPGRCPILSRPEVCPENQRRVCNYDVDCRSAPDLKCCDNGCSKRCVAPVDIPTPTPGGLAGRCPPYSPHQKCPDLVQDYCTCDSDCGEKDKCCFDGCRRICRKTAGRVCATSVDIVYLMDSSASIGEYEYEQEKSFVKDLARIFQVGATRAGVVIYSDYPQVTIKFDEKNDVESFANAVDDIPFLGNRTRIDRALEEVSKLFGAARRGVPKILIVLTDGRQTKDPDSVPLLQASQPLRNQGVKTYAVGVGHDIDKDELRALVDEPSHVFYVGSFQELIRESQTIAEEACKGAERLCSKHADVGFLVDASESISKEDFQKQKDAVNEMAKNFLESSDESRVGVIVYSDQPELSIDFGEYSSKEDLYRRVNGLAHKMSHTRTDLALKFANRTLFAGSRLSVPKIVIVFTDGIQTPGNGVESLDKAVQPLLQKGVRVFAVSVGTTVDMDELYAMVQNPEDVFQVASFSELVEKASEFSQATCKAPTHVGTSEAAPRPVASTTAAPKPTVTTTAAALPRPQCNTILDVVFLMDSSRSINLDDYYKEKNFVKELAAIFKVGGGSRASVIIYSDDPELKIRFDDFSNLRDFSNAVDRLPFIMRRTRIDKALKMASEVLKDARPRIPKAVIVMTDGIQSRDSDAMSLNRAADYVHEQGARILVVGIGPKIVREELNLMVKSRAHVFTVESFDSLIRAARNVAVRTCSTPVLKPSNKTSGLCPEPAIPEVCSSTADKCSTDQSCFGAKKCCFDGCLYQCTDPILPTVVAPVVKPGFCPGRTRLSCESVFDLCRDDQSCSGPDKCCFDGCRFFCTDPQDSLGGPTESTIQHEQGLECSGTFDLAFVVDTSSAVGKAGFNMEKEFVKNLAGKFSIGEVQLGLILFSDAPLLFVRFGGATSTSLDDFNQAVDRLPYLSGQPRIARALQSANVHLFPGGRANVPNTLLLITRGTQARSSDSLTKVAKELRDRNVKVFVLGVGRSLDRRALSVLVDNPATDLFLASSFENLQALEGRVETALCSAFGKRIRKKLKRRS